MALNLERVCSFLFTELNSSEKTQIGSAGHCISNITYGSTSVNDPTFSNTLLLYIIRLSFNHFIDFRNVGYCTTVMESYQLYWIQFDGF